MISNLKRPITIVFLVTIDLEERIGQIEYDLNTQMIGRDTDRINQGNLAQFGQTIGKLARNSFLPTYATPKSSVFRQATAKEDTTEVRDNFRRSYMTSKKLGEC